MLQHMQIRYIVSVPLRTATAARGIQIRSASHKTSATQAPP